MLSSFYPIVPGRTSNSQSRTRMLYQVQVDTIAISKLQEQLSTGRRVNKASDDPSAAVRVIGIQKSYEFKVQASQNLKSSATFLNTTETTLSEVQNLLNEARGIAVLSNTNTLSEAERKGYADQVDAILQRITNASNTRFQDRYMMSGGTVDTQPVKLEGSRVRFFGDDNDLLSAADEDDLIAHNITAQKALGVISSGVVSTIDLDPGVLPSTRLEDLNGGQGVAGGAIEFSSGTEQFSIDIAGAESLADVVERINQVKLDGRPLVASLTTTGLSIDYQDHAGGTLRISDVGVGSSARDLGIATSTPAPSIPILGNDLDPILRKTTKVSQLQAGTGIDLQGGIMIKQGGKSFRVELSNAQSIEDIINQVQRSGAAVRADVTPDGRSLQIRSYESGTDFTIEESQLTLASRLGLRTFSTSTRLESLNHGIGVQFGAGPDLVIGQNNGGELPIDLDGAVTIQDVIDRINNNVANQDPATRVVAQLHPTENTLLLSSTTTGATQPISIRVSGGSEVAWNLGLVPIGETESVGTVSGSSYVLKGTDPNPHEVKGVFNSLVRLRDAIASENLPGTDRAIQLLDEDIDHLSLARGEVGVRLQRIDRLQETNQETQVELKSQESDLIDADLAQLISELTARQAAQEASLQLLAQTSRLSLFDFL